MSEPQTILMQAPDGRPLNVPLSHVERLESLGAKRMTPEGESAVINLLKSAGSGILRGVETIGNALGRADIHAGPAALGMTGYNHKKMLKEAAQEGDQKEEAYLKNASAPERMAYKVTNWVSEGVPFASLGGTTILGAKGAKAAAKAASSYLGKDAGIGGASAILQETGMPALFSDLAVLTAAKSGKALKRKLSAKDIVQSEKEALSPHAREAYESVYGKMSNPQEAAAKINFPSASQFLDAKNIVAQDDAGELLLKSLKNRLQDLQDIRRDVSAPLYKANKESPQKVNVGDFQEWLEKFTNSQVGKSKKSVQKIEKLFKPSLEDFSTKGTYSDPQKYKNIDFSQGLTPDKIQKNLEEINDEISAALKGGRSSQAQKLMEIKDQIKTQLFPQTPTLEKATKVYAEHSIPLEEISEHSILEKAFKDKTYDAKVFSDIVPPALKSKSVARDLVRELKEAEGGKESLEAIKSQVYGQILKDISSNDTGTISLQKIASWKMNHPGAFILDPSLEKKLSNVSNAKYFEQEFLKKVMKEPIGQTLSSDSAELFGLTLKKVKKLKNSPLNIFRNKLNKIPPERRKEYVNEVLQDSDAAEFMFTPINKIERFIDKNPRVFENIVRSLNDWTK